ncbi:CU044_2847 family protein [Cryobacterium sp. MLB-32]|uniref:CU044_2847 family protein n=1 Tax=Cryobacterium sp. MLB-32 TaxID=1529318 RepID=UPI0006908164|nr:CU044_2847 family protein [Cryobacterium sp. MLB-32]
MAQLVEFPLARGGVVLVEATAPTGGVMTRGMDGAGVFARARQSFEDAVGNITPAVEGVIDQLLALAERPDDVSVTFGLDLHAEAGAFIAAASTTANFTVTLTWHSTRAPGPNEPGA